MNVLISGGTGLIGGHLARKLISSGHRVILLSRLKTQAGKIPLSYWDPSKNRVEKDVVASADVIIHLAGTNVGAGRWTSSRKRSIVESRVKTTEFLFNTVNSSTKKPQVFISASGVNYYGVVTSNEIFNEADPPGDDFLSGVCVQWENAALSFETIGARTVIFRNSVVLAPNGGIVSRLYLPFKAGLGVIPGTGKQYIPWIHIDDLCNMYLQAINNEDMKGAYNAVSPGYVDFSQFAHEYASALSRKIILPRVPSVILRLAFGEMSKIILEGSRISAQKILDTGFRFQYPSLKDALGEIFKTQR